MSDSSMMRWYPDREPDPRPIHGWDPPMPASRRADITFLEEDDPEAAEAWLNDQLALISAARESANRLNGNMVNVPISPERQNLQVATEWVRDDQLTGVQWTPEDMASPVITAEEIRASMAEDERVRERIASLPDGELTVQFGRWHV